MKTKLKTFSSKTGLEVRDALDRQFPERWIGRGGPTPWPARSPDLTPLDFFFWGFIKDQVYATPVRDIVELRHKIMNAIGNVTQVMLTNTWRNFQQRLDFMVQNGGDHCEIRKCFYPFFL